MKGALKNPQACETLPDGRGPSMPSIAVEGNGLPPVKAARPGPPRLTPNQQALVERNTKLVWFVIYKCGFRPTGMDSWDDLYQVGCVGLLKAAQKYDAGRGCAFTSLAVVCVQSELRDYARRARAGMRSAAKAVSLDALTDDAGRPYVDRLADNAPPLEETVLDALLVRDVLALLRKHDPSGMLLGWLMGETQAQIAKRTGCAQPTVSRKIAGLQKALRAEGLKPQSTQDT